MVKKIYVQLWTGFGLANLGGWIYMIALNLYIWHLTHSPGAVAMLYVIGPFARIISSFIAGSIVDRANKKSILIISLFVRACIVGFMPLITNLTFIYAAVFIANMLNSYIQPSMMVIITKLVTEKDRPRFNAIYSSLSSGCFMIGPALSGIIIAATSIKITMWINVLLIMISIFVIRTLPNVNENKVNENVWLTVELWIEDVKKVWVFVRQKTFPMLFFVLYSFALMIAFSLDSQEASYLKDVQLVSDASYGIIVGMTGIGSIIGGILAVVFVKRFTVNHYISIGLLLTLVCYLIFYVSTNLFIGVAAFIMLGFFMAFSNTGYTTFYQQCIPTSMMGRFGNALSLIQNITQILLTLCLGYCCELFSIQMATSILALLGVIVCAVLCGYMLPKKYEVVTKKTF